MATQIIAECGLYMRDTRGLIHACKEAGADYVKLQFLTDPYRLSVQRGNVLSDFYRFRRSPEEWEALAGWLGPKEGMLTVFTPRDVIEATRLGIYNLKVGHAESRNKAFIRLVRSFAMNLFLTSSELYYEEGFQLACDVGAFAHLRCVAQYPAPTQACIDLINRWPGGGYSDHSGPTLDAAMLAIDLGLSPVEIHVHPDDCPGDSACPDHAVSKSVTQLKELVAYAKNRAT